jgi:hypothetical protein
VKVVTDTPRGKMMELSRWRQNVSKYAEKKDEQNGVARKIKTKIGAVTSMCSVTTLAQKRKSMGIFGWLCYSYLHCVSKLTRHNNCFCILLCILRLHFIHLFSISWRNSGDQYLAVKSE